MSFGRVTVIFSSIWFFLRNYLFTLLNGWLIAISALFFWGGFYDFTCKQCNDLKNICFCIATNICGIIFTTSIVKYFFDKTEGETEKNKEGLQILRFDSIVRMVKKNYVFYFNALVSEPISGRLEVSSVQMQEKIEFKDLSAMYVSPVFGIYAFSGKSAVEVFFEVEDDMREVFLAMLKQIDFDYYHECREILENFVAASFDFRGRDVILNIPRLHFGEEKETLTEGMSKMIAQRSTEKALDYEWDSCDGEGLAPYYLLFQMLIREKDFLEKYDKFINKLKTERCKFCG